MKAVRMVQSGSLLELHHMPVPSIRPTDILVRIRAAGICHSDVHYRAGRSTMGKLPLTLGHEVAGTVEAIGESATELQIGDRVCLHYNLTCGACAACTRGNEQFCRSVAMLGHHVDGGYAEYVAIPARNAVPLPDAVSFEAGATLMCAAATAFHALKKGRLAVGETVAVFGIGGLGAYAVQLARAAGALEVFAVDRKPEKLRLAADYGAVPIDAAQGNVVDRIFELTNGQGVDVALEMVGSRETVTQAIDCVGHLGRAVVVGLSQEAVTIDTSRALLRKEAEIIGSNDHLLRELPLLVELARRKAIDTSRIVSEVVPLDAASINRRLDALGNFTSDVRAVIVP